MNLLPVTIVILNICVMIGFVALTVFVVAALSWVIKDIFFENSRKNDEFYKPYSEKVRDCLYEACTYANYNEGYKRNKRKEQENDIK